MLAGRPRAARETPACHLPTGGSHDSNRFIEKMKKYRLYNDVLGWLCFVVAAFTYLMTVEPTASFWDCPEFISHGVKLDDGHQPGNPIF